MPSVLAYQAGLESTNTQLSYGLEATWALLPTIQFQSVRIISESLAHKKTRTRPGEIRGDRQAAPAITTQENASGSIVLPVYYSQAGFANGFDDLISCVLGGDWQTPATIAGIAGDIALTPTTLISTLAAKFANIQAGQVIKLSGFTNAINNGFYVVSTVVSNQSLIVLPLGFLPITETPTGTLAKVYYSGLKNGTFFKSLYLQQRLDPGGTKFFRYPGTYPTRGQISLSLGQFLQATFDVSCQQELKSIVTASTGNVIAAPNTLDMNPVAGFKGVFLNGTLLNCSVDQFSLDFSNDQAAGQYALGSALAQGMLGGTMMGTGKVRMYFRDFTYYDLFRAETSGALCIRTGDQDGNLYSFNIPNCNLLLTSGIDATGPNKSLMADFDIEMNPDTVSGCTIAIDRFPLTA